MDSARLKAALAFIEKETHLRTKSYRMLSDGILGEFLQAFSLMVRPAAVLEIGTFTGYATLCLARGVKPGGLVDTIEKDDEMTDIFSRAFDMAGLPHQCGAADTYGRLCPEPPAAPGTAGEPRIRSFLADALTLIPHLQGPYDIVYIDADKRLYHRFYDLIISKVRPGGYILADNVLWSGKISMDSPPSDRQTSAIVDFNHTTATDPRVETVTIPVRDGLAVIHKKRD